MDTYRGNFVDRDYGDEAPGYDYGEDEHLREAPPSPVGQDERRMQVRAYNHWASLLNDRNFPSIEDLDPEALPDFGPYSVLLDFTAGIDNPAVQYLGDKLAAECGANDSIETLDDVPSRSLLSRITDHYMQILANQAPIGFEAEFVNQREKTILYRGILLPFSSDDDTIDFIYGVINWKEMVDQLATDELMLEVDQALEAPAVVEPRYDAILPDWADGPADSQVLDLAPFSDEPGEPFELPEPGFGAFADASAEADEDADEDEDEGDDARFGSLSEGFNAPPLFPQKKKVPAVTPPVLEGGYASYDLPEAAPAVEPLDLGDFAAEDEDEPLDLAAFGSSASTGDGADMGLADWLASARELAEVALGSEDRTRQALYAAIGRAYDFSLAAAEAPEEFAELVADSGLSVQERAPLLPVVKLVFGADYDKTRLTEYATALGHAHRLGLARGALAGYLGTAQGGLKGVIGEERRFKQGASATPPPRSEIRTGLARKLRKLETHPLSSVAAEGSEFTLLVARRLPSGEVVLLGEIADDIALLEKAAKKLVTN
jgi:hypothetical protein